MLSAQQTKESLEAGRQQITDAHVTSIERRLPARRGSRGDKNRLSPSVIINVVQTSDLLLLMLSGLLSWAILNQLHAMHAGSLFVACITGSLVAMLLLARGNSYLLSSLRFPGKQLLLFPGPLLAGGCSAIVCLFLIHKDDLSFREWPLLWIVLSAIVLFASRYFLARLLRGLIESGRLARRVAVIGAGELSREFIERLRPESDLYTVVGLYDDRTTRIPTVQEGVRVRGSVLDLLARSREEQIDLIVIALPLKAVYRISTILEAIGSAVADICLTTDFAGFRYKSSQISSIGGNPVVLIGERPLKDWQAAKKAAFDIVVGSAMLVLLSPLLVLIALIIRLDSPGPVLFRQPRLGFNNRVFTCYKFRTMRHGMADPGGGQQATRGDPRVTRPGKWLRALSLDELPQLLNVLQGSMSLVGPRPHPLNTKAANKLFADVVARYASRHRVRPGMTGWAQVNGWRGETKTVEQIENRVACDLAYIDNWTVWLDLRILMLTLTREILSSHAF